MTFGGGRESLCPQRPCSPPASLEYAGGSWESVPACSDRWHMVFQNLRWASFLPLLHALPRSAISAPRIARGCGLSRPTGWGIFAEKELQGAIDWPAMRKSGAAK